jgi:hypothetical protein
MLGTNADGFVERKRIVNPDHWMAARQKQLAGSAVLAVLQELSGVRSWNPPLQTRLESAIAVDLQHDRQDAGLAGYESLGHMALASHEFDAAEQA